MTEKIKGAIAVFWENNLLKAIILGVLVFCIVLMVTLNQEGAFLVAIAFFNLNIFKRSFHYGLVFLLGVSLLLPAVEVFNGTITIGELLIIMLAIIGITNLFLDKYKLKIFKVFYYLGALIFSISIAFFLENGDGKIIINQQMIKGIIFVLVIYPILAVSFQYIFQTVRRLERFFLMIFVIGLVQSILTLLFFNNNSFISIDNNLKMALLVITIPVTIGLWLTQKSSLSTLSFPWLKTKTQNVNKFVDSLISEKSNTDKNNKFNNKIINLKQVTINKQLFFVIGLIIQLITLIFSGLYLEIIIVSIGVFIIGILMRHNKIVGIILGLLLTIIIVLPVIDFVSIKQLTQSSILILEDIKKSNLINLLWRGVVGYRYNEMQGTFFVIFGRFGLLSLGIFILGLVQYFREIRNSYLKSEEFERIWIVVILAIFIEFILLGIFVNIFFAWPTAVLFWLLYGALQNLKGEKKEYRLMETRLINNKNL
jgi:hypothetical protein